MPILSFLFALMVSGSAETEAGLLLAREPLTVPEIRLLGLAEDIRALEILEEAFERRLEVRRRLGRFAPRDLDEELAEALRGIEILDESAAHDRARALLEQVPATCSAASTAREVLARQGDISIIREALSRFFEDPERWGTILGEAARSTEDPRLEDFREMARRPIPTAFRAFFQTRIERELADSTDEWKLADMLFWAEENPSFTTVRILSWIPQGSVHEGWVSHQLSVFADTREGPTRLRALAALGWRKATDRASVLLEALRDDDPLVVAIAARALGQMQHQKAATELERLTQSSDERVAAEAIRALVSMGGKDEALRLSERLPNGRFVCTLPLLEVLDGRLEDDAAALIEVVNRIAKTRDRHRAIRFLAERDSPVFADLGLGEMDVAEVYPYLARSSHRAVRSLVLRAAGRTRGSALAALLLSPRATFAEKEEAARALGDSWPEAIARGGAQVIKELDRLSLRDSPAKAYRDPSLWPEARDDPAMLDTLVLLPGPEARRALESVGSVSAVERLMKRQDRLLSIPALGRLRRQGERDVREAVEVALLGLGAPGSLAIMQRALARPESIRALLPTLANAPRATEAFALTAGAEGSRPDVQAAVFAYCQGRPSYFRPLLLVEQHPARRRLHAAMALSAGEEKLPLLVDSALNDPSKVIRLVAFRGLSEIELGPFAARLHRAAGDEDPRIRWVAAMALTPTGEVWAMRLLAAEMDQESPRDQRAFRSVLRRLPPDESRRLLEDMFWDETGNAFTDHLFYERVGGFVEDDEERAWSLLSKHLDESPFTLFMAAGIDTSEAAKAVYSRLPQITF